MKKRFIIVEKSTGKFIASVYAERFESFGAEWRGAEGGHFYIGQEIIASAETRDYSVFDSGGVMAEFPINR